MEFPHGWTVLLIPICESRAARSERESHTFSDPPIWVRTCIAAGVPDLSEKVETLASPAMEPFQNRRIPTMAPTPPLAEGKRSVRRAVIPASPGHGAGWPFCPRGGHVDRAITIRPRYHACRAALRRGLAPRRSLTTVYVSPRAHSVRALLSGLLEDGAECRDARVRRFEAMSRRSQTCARSTRTRGRLHAFTGGQQAPDSHVRPRREKHPPASRTRGHRWRNQTRAAPAPSLRSLP